MSAHVLLNLLNELGGKDKMRGWAGKKYKMWGFAEHFISFPKRV